MAVSFIFLCLKKVQECLCIWVLLVWLSLDFSLFSSLQRAHVPEFGNWETQDVPYTSYFEKARKGKSGGKMLVNPNDPQENPDAFSGDRFQAAPAQETPPPAPPGSLRQKHERRPSREDSEFRKATDSPARHDISAYKAFGDSPHHRAVNSGDSNRRGGRISAGSDRSIEKSPIHPHHQARATSKGTVASPSRERKGSSEGSHGFAPVTPVRSRLRSVETPDRGAALPKFGEWDENNPAAAEGYTGIFNKVREEKQMGAAKVPITATESSDRGDHKQHDAYNHEQTICGCFSWRKK